MHGYAQIPNQNHVSLAIKLNSFKTGFLLKQVIFLLLDMLRTGVVLILAISYF
jgi:hypothetical protein